MPNIFITDLDHTFLRTDLSVSDFTRHAWNHKAEHATLGIATARTYKKAMQFLPGIHINAPMILLDGALIATSERKIIATRFIGEDDGNAIIALGARFGIYPFVLALGDALRLEESFLYSTTLNQHQKQVLTRYAKDDNLSSHQHLRATPYNFKIVYMGEEALLRELAAAFEEVFGKRFKMILAPEAYVGCYFLTLLHPDADKAHGITAIQEHVGFDTSDLTVFGDNLNDLGMFQLARTSVAVANAHDELKRHADVVLERTNDEDGVAHYLEGVHP